MDEEREEGEEEKRVHDFLEKFVGIVALWYWRYISSRNLDSLLKCTGDLTVVALV